jgi:hypothetical protein
MENCNECRYINLTEEEQGKDKKFHVCTEWNVKLYHRSSNPKIQHTYIYPCDECDGRDFERR